MCGYIFLQLFYCCCTLSLSLLELPLPVVSVSSPPVTEAGQRLSLTCTVTVVEYLIVSPQVEWIPPDGSVIISDGNPSVGGAPVVSGTLSTRNITFTSLQTSHAGQYTCWASLIVLNLAQSFNNSDTISVCVQCKFALFELVILIFLCVTFLYLQ